MRKSQTNGQTAGRAEEERNLLRQVAGGDRNALTELYGRYHARLFKFLFRLTRSYASAEELVNDVMLAVWRSAGSFRGESRPSTWIFGIAYRQAMKSLRRRRLAVAPGLDVDQLPDGQVRSLEREDWLRNGLDQLPAAQKLAVELVFYLGLSYDEVAAVTDCPVNTVKTRMFHARRKLREQLTASAAHADPGGEIQ